MENFDKSCKLKSTSDYGNSIIMDIECEIPKPDCNVPTQHQYTPQIQYTPQPVQPQLIQPQLIQPQPYKSNEQPQMVYPSFNITRIQRNQPQPIKHKQNKYEKELDKYNNCVRKNQPKNSKNMTQKDIDGSQRNIEKKCKKPRNPYF